MAKLKVLPELAIIDGFKGKVDFYLYHPTCDPSLKGPGIPVARKWPRSPGHLRAQAVMDQWSDFSYAASAWNLLSEEIQSAYRALAVGSGLSGRDLFSRSYLSGLYRYDHDWRPPIPPFDVGPPAINRPLATGAGYTLIAEQNPVDLDGDLLHIAIFTPLAMTGALVGLFYKTDGNSFSTRSWVNLGNVPLGYSEHAVNLEAEIDDRIGIYYPVGQLDVQNVGQGRWWIASSQIPCTNVSFSYQAARTMSLFGWTP